MWEVTKKRIFFLISAALFLVTLKFPFWMAMMTAPSYPEGALVVRLYPHALVGDIKEINVVGGMLGMIIPDVPRMAFILFQVALVVLAVLSLVAAFSRRFEKAALVVPWVVLLALSGYAQYSLYVFGHSLPPDRPLLWFEPFTPPLFGMVVKHSIKTYHLPGLGGVTFFAAAFLPTWLAWTERRANTKKQAGQSG